MTDLSLMLLRVTRSWTAELTDPEVYEVTRGWWRTTLDRASTVDRVLAVASGRVVAAYTPERWEQSPTHQPPRYGFEGTVADDAERWLGVDVSHLFLPGAANPVRYASGSDLTGKGSPPQPLSEAPVPEGEPLILVLRLSKLWSPDISDAGLYEATRHWWVMDPAKASRVVLVLAVGDGVVREAYEPHGWEYSDVPGWEHRIGFEGPVSKERDRWVGLDVRHLFKAGAANPVRYLLASDFEEAGSSETERSLSTEELVGEAEGSEPGLVELATPVLDSLSGDLLWSMSQSAQELFHSNTLGWLLEHRPTAMQPVFELLAGGPLGTPAATEVWREWQHLDLVVDVTLGDLGDVGIVVENKCYAIPTRGQLEDYTKKKLPWQKHADQQYTRWTLLTLMAPTFELPGPWRLVRYADLATALDQVDAQRLDADAAGSGVSAEARHLFERYRLMVHRLVELEQVVDPAMALDSPFEAADLLDHVAGTKFGGPIQRMRFTGLASLVQQRMGAPIDVKAGFSRSYGMAEWFTDAGDGVEIGWQLQERHLRQALRVSKGHPAHGRGEAAKKRRIGLAEAEFPEYFNLSAAERILGSLLLPATEKTGSWKHFDPDFIYRYRKLHSSVSTDQLADALVTLTARGLEFAHRRSRMGG